jgi:hypothetical protein
MHRLFSGLAVVLAFGVAGCTNSSTSPSTSKAASTPPKFLSTLLPANEVPAVSNVDKDGSGVASMTLNVTKDSAGNVTAATIDFSVSLTGFPAGTSLTGAHIHQAAAGATAGILVSTTIASGEIVLANGSTTFVRNGITLDAAVAQGIINNPAGYYFNVHTTANPGGAARGQLVAQ